MPNKMLRHLAPLIPRPDPTRTVLSLARVARLGNVAIFCKVQKFLRTSYPGL
jgi:hypothetical protein